LETICRCKGNVKHIAECGNWEELEAVCRCKGDVKHNAELAATRKFR